VDADFAVYDSYAAMVVWGVVSSEIEQVIEFFESRNEVERMLAEIIHDEPGWWGEFRIERIELGASR
jgi:hypothetical protein